MTRRPGGRGVVLGVAYYPEYDADRDVDRDLDMMAHAGVGVIRVAESTWSDMEPRNGEYALDPLLEVLDAAHTRGIGVIVGTPTYAVPMWLARAHPEIAAERVDGSRVAWGARQEVDITAPVFRHHARRLIETMMAAVGAHPALVGVQLDNEPGLHILANPAVVADFHRRLQEQYGTVEALNRAWGLSYWSHRLSDWSDLWHPRGNTTPAYDLAWRRHQVAVTTNYLRWQRDIVRPLLPAGTPLMTCIAFNRPAIDPDEVAATLGTTAGNAYYLPQEHLDADRDGDDAPRSWYATSVAGLLQLADRMYGVRGAPFLITETGAGAIGPAWMDIPPFAGQIRQVAWALIARGARQLSYWQWKTPRSGAETFWGGVLPVSGAPGRIHHELALLAAELRERSAVFERAHPEADVALIWSNASRWMQEGEALLPEAGGMRSDPSGHDRCIDAFYRGCVDAKAQVALIEERRLPSAAKLAATYAAVFAPALTTVDDATLVTLTEYARAGGVLIIADWTGLNDARGIRRESAMPAAPLGRAGGVRAAETTTAAEPHGIVLQDGVTLPAIRRFAALEAVDSDVLATHTHPLFAGAPAWTRRRHGEGEIHCLGVLPGRALAERIIRACAPPTGAFRDAPRTVTAHTTRADDGRRVWVVHNWSPRPVTVHPFAPFPHPELRLEAWDVQIIEQETRGV